jgi:hypothetical protein
MKAIKRKKKRTGIDREKSRKATADNTNNPCKAGTLMDTSTSSNCQQVSPQRVGKRKKKERNRNDEKGPGKRKNN